MIHYGEISVPRLFTQSNTSPDVALKVSIVTTKVGTMRLQCRVQGLSSESTGHVG